MTWPTDEHPVDEEVLDLLASHAAFAADHAYFDHMNDESAVRNPDGSAQRLTAAEMARAQVRAALRNLLANGLIEAKPLDEVRGIFERGVTMT